MMVVAGVVLKLLRALDISGCHELIMCLFCK